MGWLGVSATNGAVESAVRSLALELAPLRVNAVSPGTIDSGAWDGLGEQGKAGLFAERAARTPAGRVGTVEDVAEAVLFAMGGGYLTGVVLPVDGGEPLG